MEKGNRAITTFVTHPLTGVRISGIAMAKGGCAIRRVAFVPCAYGTFSTNASLRRYERQVRSFLDGKSRDLSAIPIDLSGASHFRRTVLLTARKIPWGATVSYAQLASMAGFPRAVRAVASVMRNNPLPLIIPCHRVIRSDGSIGGFMGKTAGREVELKRKLLKRERIR
jgi:O-6-methylguanine DNA methyltransferase